MLFYSFCKTLVGSDVEVELKNDIRIKGNLSSCDAYLNMKLLDIKVLEPHLYPHLIAVRNLFIRGSVVRYIVIDPAQVDFALLEDAARRENAKAA